MFFFQFRCVRHERALRDGHAVALFALRHGAVAAAASESRGERSALPRAQQLELLRDEDLCELSLELNRQSVAFRLP